FVLHPAYPNPFSLSRDARGVAISFELFGPEPVSFALYNTTGQLVQHFEAQDLPAGRHTLQWQPDSEMGTGIYFYRLVVGTRAATGRCLIVK
ncbi:MAG: T9SS type A sorting domain-containing protein, partial [Candidatus Oleimicrobiaceae bacterium]